jgi:pimeloyl-ACP methyl ester carboxylesterase
MERKFIYREKEVFYTVSGEGKAVILVHGFGEDGTIFRQQNAFLQQYAKVIIPDLPGSGLSPLNSLLVSIDDYADCIYALIQHENITGCIMLGHSMGGYITLSFAEKYDSSLTAFGFIHSTAFADSEEKKANRQKGIEFIETHGAYSFLKTSIPNLFSPISKEAFPDEIASLIEQGRHFTGEALQQYYRAMINRADKTQLLKNTPLPVLFIIGKDDVAAPLKDVEQQMHLPACSYIHILENVGHMSMLEAPDILNALLLQFIKTV